MLRDENIHSSPAPFILMDGQGRDVPPSMREIPRTRAPTTTVVTHRLAVSQTSRFILYMSPIAPRQPDGHGCLGRTSLLTEWSVIPLHRNESEHLPMNKACEEIKLDASSFSVMAIPQTHCTNRSMTACRSRYLLSPPRLGSWESKRIRAVWLVHLHSNPSRRQGQLK